jgi:hypothetical protein
VALRAQNRLQNESKANYTLDEDSAPLQFFVLCCDSRMTTSIVLCGALVVKSRKSRKLFQTFYCISVRNLDLRFCSHVLMRSVAVLPIRRTFYSVLSFLN